MIQQSLKTALLAVLILAAPCAVLAAADEQAVQPTQATPLSSLPPPDEVVAIMGKRLSLTGDQMTQITPIIADRQQKLKAIFADSTSRSMRQRREAREVITESDKKINALLSPDQQTQYADLERQMRQQMKQRMQDK